MKQENNSGQKMTCPSSDIRSHQVGLVPYASNSLIHDPTTGLDCLILTALSAADAAVK